MVGELSQSHAKSAGIISIFILVFAVVNLITGFVFVSYGARDATGIWIGLLLLLAGVLGIITWIKRNKTVMIFFMVICIIDIITCIIQAAIAAIAFIFWQILKAMIETKCQIRGDHCDCGNEKVPMALKDCSWIAPIEAIFLVLLIVNGAATIFVFAGSIIGCIATCCASQQQQPGVVIVQQPAVVAYQQPVVVPAGAQQYPPAYNQEMTQKLLLAAILGIVTWVKKNKCTMIFFLVICIIDIITSIIQAALAGLSFLIWQILKAIIKSKCTINNGHCDCGSNKIPLNVSHVSRVFETVFEYSYFNKVKDCSWISAIEAIFLCLLMLNGLATIFVFAGSIIGCMGTCCAKAPVSIIDTRQ
ncbi:hypothetical protein QZH41_014372 [Actinostola sp. cb2023]|nr:hypothetical protein QZH41_014372 [Actinostola sp. cb2023]